MVNKIFIVFILSLLSSCNTQNKYKMKVYISNGTGWDLTSTEMFCDSATMVSKNKAIIYVDGIKSVLIAENILINTSKY